jgi:mono/diheme cytochrome c family protein
VKETEKAMSANQATTTHSRHRVSPGAPYWAWALLVALVFSGCKGGSGASQSSASQGSNATSTQAQITPEARAKAKDIYANRCAACHGVDGKGDGPGAANLTPKPANFQDKSWQASVTDQDIEKAILYGGAAVGKSPMMPSNPDLDSDPAVVAALRALVREAGQQAGK